MPLASKYCFRREYTTELILTEPHRRHRHWQRTWAVSVIATPSRPAVSS